MHQPLPFDQTRKISLVRPVVESPAMNVVHYWYFLFFEQNFFLHPNVHCEAVF